MKKHPGRVELEDDPLALLDELWGKPEGAIYFEGYKRICGAKTRQGTPCRRKLLLQGYRCSNHGGKSTGPRTPEGKGPNFSEANRRRWAARREGTATG